MDEKSISYQPQRLDGETFESYKQRRSNANSTIKEQSRGRMLWNVQERGTYNKEKNGAL